MEQIYVVSGNPRSGTSVMTHCLNEVLGEDRLIGVKFPMEEQRIEMLKKQPFESQEQYDYRMYIDKLYNPDADEKVSKAKIMNPNGFFEHPLCTVNGLSYSMKTKGIFDTIYESKKPMFCKIVSSGLNNTNPRLVKKLIYMIREPHAVAHSSENLQRNSKFKLSSGEVFDILEGKTITDPSMFISSTLLASKYFSENKIDVLFVNYEDLMGDPNKTLKKVFKFLGEGDCKKATKIIDPKLKRSYDKKTDNKLWNDAELIYKMFKEENFKEILEEFGKDDKEVNIKNAKWMCLRVGQRMGEEQCEACIKNKNFRDKLKQFSKARKIRYDRLPCAYEVAFNRKEPLISIDESIKKNKWTNLILTR